MVWCDEFVRLDPLKGAAIDGDDQRPKAPPIRLASARNEFASFQLLVGPVKRDATVSVKGGALKGKGKAGLSSRQYDVFVEWYQPYDGVWYPEVCVPQRIVGGSSSTASKSANWRGGSWPR